MPIGGFGLYYKYSKENNNEKETGYIGLKLKSINLSNHGNRPILNGIKALVDQFPLSTTQQTP